MTRWPHTMITWYHVTGVTVDQVMIGVNPRRTALILCAPGTGFVYWKVGGDAAGNQIGLTLTVGAIPVILRRDELGDCICQEVHAFPSASTAHINVAEIVDTTAPIGAFHHAG